MEIAAKSCVLILVIGTTLLAWMLNYEKKISKRTVKVAERDIENATKTIDS